MDEQQTKAILAKAKLFFRTRIVERHQANTKKLAKLKNFTVNPFLDKYLANFAFGNNSPENIAKALIYPRILGTSISTIFGTQLQFFCNDVLSGYASTTSGIDIEFIDAIDNRRKYCQIKAGPNTINYDDVTTIKNHFTAIKHLARTNRSTDINPSIDCLVGVFYGNFAELSVHYKKINEEYSVLVGKDFWHHLTGSESFYDELINVFAEVAVEMDSRILIEQAITDLAGEISKRQNA